MTEMQTVIAFLTEMKTSIKKLELEILYIERMMIEDKSRSDGS